MNKNMISYANSYGYQAQGSNGHLAKTEVSRGTQAMMVLSKILQHVYVPLEDSQGRQDNLQNIRKFVSQISHTIQQVTGTVTIKLPEHDDLDDEQAARNQDLMRKFEIMMVSLDH